MLKNLLTLSLMLIVASTLSFAQNWQVLKSNGDIIPVSKKFLDKSENAVSNTASPKLRFDDVTGTIDTIDIATDFGVEIAGNNFIWYGQDIMMQWFEAPADMVIKAAGVNFQTSDEDGNTFGIRLVKLNWSKEQLLEVVAGGPQWIGYYTYEGDGANNIEPFGEDNPDGWDAWVDQSEGLYPIPPWQHDDYDLWSDLGFTLDAEPILQDVRGASYHFLSMIDLGVEPTLLQGEIFGVVVVNN